MLQTSMHVHPQMGWAIIYNTNRFVCLAFARSPKKTQVNISLYEWRGAVVLPGLILMELMDNDVSGWGGW